MLMIIKFNCNLSRQHMIYFIKYISSDIRNYLGLFPFLFLFIENRNLMFMRCQYCTSATSITSVMILFSQAIGSQSQGYQQDNYFLSGNPVQSLYRLYKSRNAPLLTIPGRTKCSLIILSPLVLCFLYEKFLGVKNMPNVICQINCVANLELECFYWYEQAEKASGGLRQTKNYQGTLVPHHMSFHLVFSSSSGLITNFITFQLLLMNWIYRFTEKHSSSIQPFAQEKIKSYSSRWKSIFLLISNISYFIFFLS